MKTKAVSPGSDFAAGFYVIENRARSVLALGDEPPLPHDVFEGKAVNHDKDFLCRVFALTASSLYGGYSLVTLADFTGKEIEGARQGKCWRGMPTKTNTRYPQITQTTQVAGVERAVISL